MERGIPRRGLSAKNSIKNHHFRSEIFVTLYFMNVVNYAANGRRKVCGPHLLHPGHVVSAKSINAMRERFPDWLSGKYHFVSVPVSPRYLHQPFALMATPNYRRPRFVPVSATVLDDCLLRNCTVKLRNEMERHCGRLDCLSCDDPRSSARRLTLVVIDTSK